MAQAEGSAVLGDGAIQNNFNSDSEVTRSALEIARQVVADGLSNQRAVFDVLRESNALVSGAGSKALEMVNKNSEMSLGAVAAAKTDGGQTERLVKSGGMIAVALAFIYMLVKK